MRFWFQVKRGLINSGGKTHVLGRSNAEHRAQRRRRAPSLQGGCKGGKLPALRLPESCRRWVKQSLDIVSVSKGRDHGEQNKGHGKFATREPWSSKREASELAGRPPHWHRSDCQR